MGRSGRAEPKRLALSILKNPMVVAALAAIAASALPFRMPELLWGVVKDVAGVTTTISFIGARPADGFDSADIPAPLCGSGLPEPKPVRADGPLRRPYRRGLLSHGGGYGSGRALGRPVGLCRNHTVDFYNVLLYLPLPQFRDAVTQGKAPAGRPSGESGLLQSENAKAAPGI